ncbi:MULTISPECIES: phosphatase domain-containing protein [Halobacteriovorax]|uniref:DUF2183 domain-containing protein n=1 Tax=Halobacteriovorax vibrionivorans TaxID=2152716 RepID=A0ABY0IFK5_9BACT|nr:MULTISPECIES: phosphatase domain-containing protein [Halobacteriovorax]AYF44176.1 PF09949 family protein [Halobacteriovorax sp. BALOs_7]RZF21304.1 DUF2183 domain-containing protein [Halobacteriovorax vibrionivorans]TGD47938.1 DUF2183 domain-containing protein [Halobacteriovorax sp. Y22]
MKKLIQNSILTLLISTFSTAGLAAETILISDIDDTIKIGHIRDKIDTVKNAFKVNNIFLGMADLYHIIKDRTGAEVYYLTNAPEELMKWSHSTLLYLGDFPQGSLEIRPIKVSTKVFKAQRLRELIEREDPKNVILVGDNGEHDNTFYHDIAQEYPEVKFYTYIRAAYHFDESNALYPDQRSFVTPFEIADNLYQRDVIEKRDSQELLDLHLKDFMRETNVDDDGPMYIPAWLRCRGHKRSFWSIFRSTLPSKLTKKINYICNKY